VTVKQDIKDGARFTAGVVWAFVVVVGLAIAVWFIVWQFHRAGTNRDDRLRRQRYEFQQTYRAQIDKGISDIAAIDVQLTQPDTDQAAVGAQRTVIVRILCDNASKLTTPYDGPNAALITKECS
jgi:uncharacterized protein HemX